MSINNVLDLRSLEPEEKKDYTGQVLEPPPDNDFEYARDNIKTTIDTAMAAIGQLAGIADQSQAPRAYEVIANLAKTIVDSNQQLLDLHKHNPGGIQEQKPHITNNNLFVGSTTELQDMIAQIRAEKRTALPISRSDDSTT